MLLGAHISTAGGFRNVPERAAAIGASAIQIFTKMPSRWAERPVDPDEAADFIAGCRRVGVEFACAHDSYLINLATPDPVLRERSYASFVAELRRASDLRLDAVVTHPGNATDGDRERGLEQNAALIQRALEEVPDAPAVLLETTAGAGQVLGATFEEIAFLRRRINSPYRERVGVCVDTCHVFAAGYDLRDRYDAVFDEFERVIGIHHIRLFHLNDSLSPLGSRRDRHAGIGEGQLGGEPFGRLMRDPLFLDIPKVIETPKGEDHVAADRRNLDLLRSFTSSPTTERVRRGGRARTP